MRFLVFSDSHGTMRYMEQAVEQEQPDVILHLGDRERDADRLSLKYGQYPMLAIPGNCDYPFPGRELLLLREWDGKRIMVTHGHKYGVKSGLLTIELAAREAHADVVVFGHTHRVFCEQRDGLWMLNPGACSGGRPSYGIIEIENGTILCYTREADSVIGGNLCC